MDLKNKAIKLAENLACLGMEDSKTGSKIFDKFRKIYQYLHSIDSSHSCYDKHDDWRKEIEIDFEKLKSIL
jgi:hypothetical protein